MDGEGFNRPLFTRRSERDVFCAHRFLDSISKLLQSKAEIVGYMPLKIITLVVRPLSGGAYKPISQVLSSHIVTTKKRWLLNYQFERVNLCLAASLLGLLNRSCTDDVVRQRAEEVHRELGIPIDKPVSFNQLPLFESYFDRPIKIINFDSGRWQFYPSTNRADDRTLYVMYHCEHYYGVLNLKALLGSKHVCRHCHKTYGNPHLHSCQYYCPRCMRGVCEEVKGPPIKCDNCLKFVRSWACLKTHRQKAALRVVKCERYEECRECGKENCDPDTCNGPVCDVCQSAMPDRDTHQCFMTPGRIQKHTDKYIVYDIEARQENGIHEPNYLFASHLDQGTRRWEFPGDTCVADFITMFIRKKYKGYTFLAHNSKSYDGYFILKQLVRERMKVKLITQGAKLMLIAVVALNIRFIDTLNFLPMKLSKLPKAFGFSGGKGFFPHLFNTAINQGYKGEMPDIKYYGIECMLPAEKEEFLTWYEANKHKEFDFQKELRAYCQQDVRVLAQGVSVYRSELIETTRAEFARLAAEEKVRADAETLARPRTGKVKKKRTRVRPTYIDPFQSITLASFCMRIYRQLYLKPETIALLPADLYHRHQKRYSTPAIQWLMYVAETENVVIQHALTARGEKRCGKYLLDGYAVVGGVDTAYEFNGCFYHGCPKCYSAETYNVRLGLTHGQLHRRTLLKEEFLIKKGFRVVSIWEHEWSAMRREDPRVECFLKNHQLPEPIQPRDALYGGRTSTIKMYHKAAEGEQIHYLDFTSLYPSVNKEKAYPLGHPKIIYKDFGDINQYFGLIKCEVYPPRALYLPVLPYRSDGKLMFPLCRTCLETKQTGCVHSDAERALKGTWCSIELQAALKMGYRLGRVHEVWHFENITVELFCEYIKLFLRDKQEASGYPEHCTDDDSRRAYIADYYAREGVRLRPEHIRLNPARRTLAKLCLNSLWGKFAQRLNLINADIITDPAALHAIIFDSGYEVSSCVFIDEETACLSWRYATEYPSVADNINIFVAAFTTAHARLKLYDVMAPLGERLLYNDTDSVIFVSVSGDANPVTGDYLGELTSELASNDHIVEFVSAGPKTYAYRTLLGEVSMKVKGITLNVTNSEAINFDSLKELVQSFLHRGGRGESESVVVKHPGIVRDKKRWEINTSTLQKTLRVVFDKRTITAEGLTLPYGY